MLYEVITLEQVARQALDAVHVQLGHREKVGHLLVQRLRTRALSYNFV